MKTVYTILMGLSLLIGVPSSFASLYYGAGGWYLLVGIVAALVCGAAYEGDRQESMNTHRR